MEKIPYSNKPKTDLESEREKAEKMWNDLSEKDRELLQRTFSRRGFLEKSVDLFSKVGATAAVGVAGAALGPPVWEYGQNRWNANHLESGIHSLKKEILEAYGIKAGASFKDFPSKDIVQRGEFTSMEVASLYLQYKALEQLQHVLGVYPPAFCRKFIKEIRITDGMMLKDSWEGVMRPRGTVDHEKKLVIADIQALFQSLSALFGKTIPVSVIHHEISHLVTKPVSEEEWTRMHPGVKYLWMFWKLQKEEDVPPGFASTYGTRSFQEDIATVAERLFEAPGVLEKRGEKDSILSRKIEYVKKWYEKESQGLMDKKYWADLGEGKVNRKYWSKKV